MKDEKTDSSLLVIINLKRELDKSEADIKKVEKATLYYQIGIGILFIAALLFAIKAFSSKETYFGVDNFGGYTQVQAYSEPNLSRELRLQHTEFIVRSLNSLDFINYKVTLDALEPYFMPATWNGYIKAKEEQNLFDLIETKNLKYSVAVSPARLIANNSRGLVYSDPDCYKKIKLNDGREIESDCTSTSIEAGGHTESYEFPIKRTLYANAKLVETQSFRARITITKMDNGDRKNGYVVTKYEEIY
jgi:hypothetical protein